MFCKKGVLRNFAKFTGKHLCQSLFFTIKVFAFDLSNDYSIHKKSEISENDITPSNLLIEIIQYQESHNGKVLHLVEQHVVPY